MIYRIKSYYVYIMASDSWTLYTWVTNNLERRVFEHKNWLTEWFTKKYKCHKLVYCEEWANINDMILREKQIKHFKRKQKEDLIKSTNSSWTDLTKNWL